MPENMPKGLQNYLDIANEVWLGMDEAKREQVKRDFEKDPKGVLKELKIELGPEYENAEVRGHVDTDSVKHLVLPSRQTVTGDKDFIVSCC